VSVLHATDDDLLMPVAARSILAPSFWLNELAGILVACLRARGQAIPADVSEIQPSWAAQCIGASLASGAPEKTAPAGSIHASSPSCTRATKSSGNARPDSGSRNRSTSFTRGFIAARADRSH
jgi:NADH-quinone oxidoreductase subunit G